MIKELNLKSAVAVDVHFELQLKWRPTLHYCKLACYPLNLLYKKGSTGQLLQFEEKLVCYVAQSDVLNLKRAG